MHSREWHLMPWQKHKAALLLWISVFLCVSSVQLVRFILEKRAAEFTLAPLAAAPIVVGALTIGALLNATAATSFATVLAFGCALTGACSLDVVTAAWLAGVAGAHAVCPLKKRSDLLKAGEIVILCYAGATATLGSIAGQPWLLIAKSSGFAAVSAVGAVALFWLVVAALDRSFDLVTEWGLLELCSPEQPLMRELCTQAPGTYQHSVMVAHLAEAGAQAIGANPLLARVCAYYHDIGKLKRPDFFIENQGISNVHDRLSPSLSATIISAHVRDGVEMAIEHNLPQPVIDAIGQHHGTSLITYFYYQAKAECEEHDPMLEQHYRYPGPQPRSKEAALVMLSDAIEAATRTLDRTSPSRLEHFITQLVEDRRTDNQLDECDLTFGDLKRIIKAFVQTLTASRHQRIDYPEVTTNDGSQKADRNNDLQSVSPPGSVAVHR
jgi:putative nucleotidyltransferase with HDIG domain